MCSCGRKDGKKSKLCACLTILFSFVSLIFFFFAIAGTYILASAQKYKPGCTLGKMPFFVTRGNLSVAQENSLPAILNVTHDDPVINYGVQIDVMTTGDDDVFLVHDQSLERTTGSNQASYSVPWSQLQTMSIHRIIDGTQTYPTTQPFVKFTEALEYLCDETLPYYGQPLYIRAMSDTMKAIDKRSKGFATTLIDQLFNNSGCYNRSIIIGAFHPQVARYVYKELKSKNIPQASLPLISVIHHPNTWPFGVYFWLKTRFLLWYANASMAETHLQVWDKQQSVLDSLKSDSYCVGIYGGTMNDLSSYATAAQFQTVVVGKTGYSPGGDFADGDVNYSTSQTMVGGMIALSVILYALSFTAGGFAIITLLRALGRTISFLCKCCMGDADAGYKAPKNVRPYDPEA